MVAKKDFHVKDFRRKDIQGKGFYRGDDGGASDDEGGASDEDEGAHLDPHDLHDHQMQDHLPRPSVHGLYHLHLDLEGRMGGLLGILFAILHGG